MTPTFLHVGCGTLTKQHTTRGFLSWNEIRLDINPAAAPDVIGSMTDMAAVTTASVQAVFSSHNIEHLYPHEVPLALAEFLRVLDAQGYALITCPDLRSVCALVAQDKLTEPAYTSPAGPVTPLDVLYGHRPALEAGNLFMAHRCGFTETLLRDTLLSAGFATVATLARPAPAFDLWALASKPPRSEQEMSALMRGHLEVGG
jgi:hypothetical protein